MPYASTASVNLFEPVGRAAQSVAVPPCVGAARAERNPRTGYQSRSCDNLICDRPARAALVAVEFESEVVNFKPGFPLQEHAARVTCGRELCEFDRGRG